MGKLLGSKLFKRPLLSAINDQAQSLMELAREVEQADIPDMEGIEDLPRIIRQRRESLGLSCNQAAELTGVSATTWHAMESDNANPRLKTLKEAARTLNLGLWIEKS